MRQPVSAGRSGQHLARILPEGDATLRLHAPCRISAEAPRRHGKNRTPQVAGPELRSMPPYHDGAVVSEAGEAVARVPSTLAVDHIRGGAQALPFAGAG